MIDLLQLISASSDQAAGLLAQPPEDTAFGDEHGIGGDAQLGRGLRGRQAVDGLALKGVPGRRENSGSIISSSRRRMNSSCSLSHIRETSLAGSSSWSSSSATACAGDDCFPRQNPRSRCTVIVRSQTRNAPARPECSNAGSSRTIVSKISWVRSSASADSRP